MAMCLLELHSLRKRVLLDSSVAASSSSSAAVEPRLPKHHVFLSFSGEDTRTKFTSHLYSALSEKYITFKDDVNLKIGCAISPALLEAIEESEISIIIFSENYASSSWCLDELLHILKCKKEKARTVLPIFIDIDPSHVRHQKETYAAAFEKHKERFKSEKLREWRQALKEAAGISGCVSGEKKSESEIVEEVVERVRRELDTIKSKSSDDFKGLVGISERLEKIKSFLDSQAVRVVGIWGMGGIGKTTLAKAVFSRFYNDFEGSCFAPNVRENARNKGLDTFKREVFSELLGEKNLNIFISDAIDRLSRRKVLLVLDDVESPNQLEDLVGDRDRFCPGSKIIVTSRSKLRVDEEYKVEELNSNDACKLFYLNAFRLESCRRGFEEISDRVVEYTKGHPLALKVLGASVFYFLESIDDWVQELEKLKRTPNNEIRASLERSWDALDAEEKELFLDIACFFKGERRYTVVGILEDKPIAGLVRKSLITIKDDKIEMHDLIQEMGQDIVFKLTDKLGKRSRLWIAQDVSYVLENNKGTKAIEGIYLPWNDEDVHLRPDVFEKMRKLRLLKFYDASYHSFARPGIVNKVYIDGDLKYLPDGLRYLHWECYPGKSLPSNFKPQFLVELHMPYSELEQLWDGVQKLGSLKHINLRFSFLLTKIPDLSLAPKLESINLFHCRNLIHIPSLNFQATLDKSAYQCQQKIFYRSLLFNGCKNERSPGSIILSFCERLTTLPKLCGNITLLDLSWTALKELPSSIESLENLLYLDLKYCDDLKRLPKLPRNIEVLSLPNCSKLESFPPQLLTGLCSLTNLTLTDCNIREIPDWLGSLTSLTELDLYDNAFEGIPACIGMLYKLEGLKIGYCKNLRSLPASIGMLYKLGRLDISNCENLQSLPASIGKLCKLKELDTSNCGNLQSLPASIGMLYKLERLDISNCENLRSLPASIGMLYKLEWLDISNCENLRSLPASIGMLYKLKRLNISNCENLRSLPELPLFVESVDANGCSLLEIVSTLRSTLTLGRWLDKYDSHDDRRRFSFVDCANLGKDAINNMFTEFLYKVFCTATTPLEVVVSKRVIRQLVFRYSTKEIPRWFNNQSEGSSITITLPPNWYNAKTFLGFVVSAVFRVDEVFTSWLAPLNCELHLVTNKDRFRVDLFKDFVGESCLDHIVMWYKYFDHSKANFEKYQKASLEFSCSESVKRCGVRTLYLKDAVEESNDGSTANFESWRTDVIDSDTDYATAYDSDEPPPKRNRNL